MSDDEGLDVAMLVLRVASQVVDGIQEGLAKRGFSDVRPAHGFTFVRISAGNATTAAVAEHLGVTKQAASQLISQLVERGYVEREADPSDGRARQLRLTKQGWACTQAAEQAAADITGAWRQQLGTDIVAALSAALKTIALPGRLRPAW